MYTYSEVFNESIKYFDGDEFAAKVFVDKYALKTPQEEYLELTPTDMHHRLAKEFARIESYHPNPLLEDEIFSLFEDFKYIVPQGSPMSAIGNPYKLQSLSNCFVIAGVNNPSLDSYGGILLADQELAQIMKRRGGVGLDISGIRPKGAVTANSAGTTDGIAIFMERFSNTCREVAQNGRRGALMQTLSINHPEIETFINIKRDLKKVTGANISIRLNDAFMNAVKNNEDYVLRYPVDASIEDAKITKTVKAVDIWNQIVDSAWTSAEPGGLFWDACIENTPSDIYKDFGHASVSTNPCLSGDTLIAVADGRNAVSIKQLADEGKDVAVYSFNKQTGVTEIKMGRNPRITGFNQKLLRVTLGNESYLDTTTNHKFILTNGKTVEAKDLIIGDLVPEFTSFTKQGLGSQYQDVKILKVEALDGDHTVYNITVEDNHTFAVITSITDFAYMGLHVMNCGELILPIADSCRLTAINLSSYVNFPFTSLATFDFDKFHKHTIIAQRLMDDVVQLEIESVDKIIAKIKSDPESDEVKRTELNLWNKIREMAVSGRRTGLGITALGDALAMLNIKYGSKESIEMTGKIYKALAVGSHTSSCILAKERGAFPIFNYELERKHKYISKIMEACGEEVVEMWKTTGRRSIANTTTAPTGSVSAETQTTSGIEPAFLLSYVRRKKHNPSDKNARVDFTDEMGDKWQEFIVYHHGVKQWMDVTKETDISKSPYWGATSNEIDWVASVEMQAAAQDWTDHCLSKTCVTKDALIETDKGLFYMDELISFDETKTLENNDILVKNCNYDFVKPSHMHILKESNLIELELENGLSIKVTPKERFMCDGKWEYIESLNIGDKIKISK